MIKRPLVYMVCAYLMGIYLAWLGLSVITLLISVLSFAILIGILILGYHKRLLRKEDRFLWFLPLILILGLFATHDQLIPSELSSSFAQKTDCSLSGCISMIVNKESGKALYLKNNTVILPDKKRYVCENVIVYCYNKQSNNASTDASILKEYLVGNKITVYGTLKKFSEAENPGQFNEKLYYLIENIDFKMSAERILLTDSDYSGFHVMLDRFRDRLINVYQKILPPKEAGTIIAMLLGDKYLLDDEIKELYQKNGIAHILAISGLHISLIGMFIFQLLKKIRLPEIPATLIAIFSIYAYGVLTNFSVSTNRAVVMMAIMLIGRLLGKTYDMLSSIAFSALIILLQNPLQLFSVGFILSYGAVLGIAVIYPCLKKILPAKNVLLDSILISFSAQLATTPFILWSFYQFPSYGLLVNLLILPFVSVLTLSSLLAGVAGVVMEPLGMFAIGGSAYILKLYELICRIGSVLPHALITTGRPTLFRLILFSLMMFLFLIIGSKVNKKSVIIIPVAALIILLLPARNPGLEVTMLNVGQGDSIYMQSKSRTTYLIDGGSSDVLKVAGNRIEPFILSRGTDHIDYAIMTHSDNDHISGLKEMLESGRVRIKKLVLPDISNKDDAYLELEKAAINAKINVSYINSGDTILDHGLRLFCLHPTAGTVASSANAYSTVLSVTYGEFDLLLTGDLPDEEEGGILKLLTDTSEGRRYFAANSKALLPVKDYDVLKIAHHGSRSSTSEAFLELIKPELSLISCGKDNFYGHPHKELLSRLKNINSKVMITYETGAITIKTDGRKLVVKVMRK